MNTILCNLLVTCVVGMQDISPQEELAYGTVLYEYYQEHYEAAMVQVLMAESQERMGDDPLRFQIAKGSFAFANGMFNYAHGVFSDLDADQLSVLEQQRLAFHLAREYFRRQDWDKLASQLKLIRLDRSWLGRQLMHPEVEFMRAELAIQNGQLDKAQDILNTIPQDNPLRIYGLFNLGVAFYHSYGLEPAGEIVSASKFDAAYNIFDTLSHTPAYNSETQDIIQRSRVALARLKTQANEDRPTDNPQNTASLSDQLLGILPGSGRYKDLALASYASTAMREQDAEAASRVWQMLRSQKNWTASSAKAHLGLPMSLEVLSKDGTVANEAVLRAFRDAEKRFQGRLETLERISVQAEDSKWVGEFLTTFANPQDEVGEQSKAILEWQEEIGYSDWLEWLSSETVYGLLSDWSELKKMDKFLETIPKNLEALDLASKEIKRRAQAARVLLREQGLVAKRDLVFDRISELHSRVSVLNSRTAERSDEWMLSIASQEQGKRTRSLFRMRVAAEKELDEETRSRLILRIERLRGLLFFDLAENKSTRLRSISKQLKVHEDDMEVIDTAKLRLNLAEENYDFGLAINFENFKKRANGLEQAVNTALYNRQETLAREIRSGMKREIQRVEQYLLVTRIAIARTSDLLAGKAQHKSTNAELEKS